MRVSGRVMVLRGATLTLEPGTRVEFLAPANPVDAGQLRLYVQEGGRLVAEGTEGAPVVFASTDAGVPWYGIELHSGHDRDVLVHCEIRDAKAGVACVGSSPRIESCTFRSNRRAVSLWRGARPLLRAVVLEDNEEGVAVSMQSSLTLVDSVVRRSRRGGVFVERDSGAMIATTAFAENEVALQKRGAGPLTVSGCRLRGNRLGVRVELGGEEAVLEGNRFEDNVTAVSLVMKAFADLVGNVFRRNAVAISIEARSGAGVQANDFLENGTAVLCSKTSHPQIRRNRFVGNERAVAVEYSSYPVIEANNFEGNRLAVALGANQSYRWSRVVWGEAEWTRLGEAYGTDRVRAADNYWGRETTARMERGERSIPSIRDGSDGGGFEVDGRWYPLDRVVYEPFRRSPVRGAGAEGDRGGGS
ncbi:MAG: hypothetical protein Kow0092_15870 [Deferrisomatales bacterium]